MTLSAFSRATCAAWLLIGNERMRQVTKEGWTAAHDDQHAKGELLLAARCYFDNARLLPVMQHVSRRLADGSGRFVPRVWPWAAEWWKPTERDRDMVKAGALAWAEIDRMKRKSERDQGEPARPLSAGRQESELAIEFLDGVVDALAACLIEAAIAEAGR